MGGVKLNTTPEPPVNLMMIFPIKMTGNQHYFKVRPV